MPRTMVHPRLKRILSESSSAVSSPPDTPSDPGKPEPESEDQDPEVESVSHSNQKGSDGEQEASPRVAPAYESPGSRMDISDEEAGAPKIEQDDRVLVADADASSETQKPAKDAHSRMNIHSSGSITPLPIADDGDTPPASAAQSVARDESPQPPAGPSKSTSRSPSIQSTKDFKDLSPVPPSTSVSANRSASPPRPSLKIKLKLGTKSSRIASETDVNEETLTTARGSRSRGSGKRKGKGKGKGNGNGNGNGNGKEKESASKSLTFTLPPRTRTETSEASSRASPSRSQSSQHSSVESEDAEEADAESENENDVRPERDDHIGMDDDAMDVDLELPVLEDRLGDDVESEGDGDNPDDDMDDGGDGDSEVLPGGGKARLTARQAVLASMVGADHVELETATSSRKKQLTSEEIALRREETARKRKNMSEKKLEDEKTETINRLLKKQSSRSRAKRSTLLNSSVVPTPQSPHSGDEGESDAVLGGAPSAAEQKGPTISGPVWRWVSNSLGFRVGIPNEALSALPASEDGVEAGDGVEVGGFPVNELPKPRLPAICDVSGCEARRKYRLVNDFERGACGMEHLRILMGAA